MRTSLISLVAFTVALSFILLSQIHHRNLTSRENTVAAAPTTKSPAIAPTPVPSAASTASPYGKSHLPLSSRLLDPDSSKYLPKYTPLELAAIRGQLDVVKTLVESGTPVDSADSLQETPLMGAVRANHKDIVAYLLDHGANLQAMSQWHTGPFDYAADNHDMAMLAYLFSRDAKSNRASDAQNTLYWTTSHDVIDYLIDQGADLNKPVDNRNYLELSQCLHHDIDLLKFLISRGALVDPTDDLRTSMLSSAAGSSDLDMMEFLISKGADIHRLVPAPREDIIMFNIGCIDGDAIKLLVKHGLSLKDRDYRGDTALIEATALAPMQWQLGDEQDTVSALLDCGAEPNVRNNDGNTPLIYAAEANRTDIIEMLLAHDADIKFGSTPNMITPLMHAAEVSKAETIEYLLSKGASVDETDINGSQPLLYAAKAGKLDAVKTLVAHGANVNHKNRHGDTALGIAQANRRNDVVEFLTQHGAKDTSL